MIVRYGIVTHRNANGTETKIDTESETERETERGKNADDCAS